MILMQGTHGKTVALTTNLDLTGATVIRVRLVPPNNGTPIDKTLTQEDVLIASIGLVALPLSVHDVDVSGEYRIEAFDETPGREIPSAIGTFEVKPTLGSPPPP